MSLSGCCPKCGNAMTLYYYCGKAYLSCPIHGIPHSIAKSSSGTEPCDDTLNANCADCDMEYGTFPDMILPDDIWTLIAPREGKYGILCPTCIAKRLDKIGLWYQDGYYNHKGWSAFNPLAEQVESLQTENAQLRAWQADAKSGRRIGCAYCGAEFVSANGKSALDMMREHMESCQQHPMAALKAENAQLKSKLSALRADVEAGALDLDQEEIPGSWRKSHNLRSRSTLHQMGLRLRLPPHPLDANAETTSRRASH